ncbi:hypothetical protein K466DRAFT_157368 [Polyporus arcularius HHB13444]|uniref:Uncharacterized protein n=1 Tax=Polyporus arcularius HHB13444 TaxID=1314778 RepID=A0A5C3PCC5_9APHY|nr:hypothetical protein K466DRAFT_157368 [Polyporus arcularius HHB13444]
MRYPHHTHTRRTPIRHSQRHTANIRHAAPPPTCAAPNRRLADKKKASLPDSHLAFEFAQITAQISALPSSRVPRRTNSAPILREPAILGIRTRGFLPRTLPRPPSACMTPRSGTREESPPTAHESRRRASTSRGWAGSSSSLLPRPKIQGRPPLTLALAEHVHVHVHVHRRPLSQLQKILAPNEPNLLRCQHGPAALTNPPRRAPRERGPGRRPCHCIGICAASAFDQAAAVHLRSSKARLPLRSDSEQRTANSGARDSGAGSGAAPCNDRRR